MSPLLKKKPQKKRNVKKRKFKKRKNPPKTTTHTYFQKNREEIQEATKKSLPPQVRKIKMVKNSCQKYLYVSKISIYLPACCILHRRELIKGAGRE